jgi:putative FmdB family regulatory protein
VLLYIGEYKTIGENMPIYEYECSNCGTRFDKMQPITSDPVKVCPNCGAEQVRRIIQPVGVIFKGSGWYINDNRKSSSDGPAPATKSDAGGDKPSEGKVADKPESKPAAKAESKAGASDGAGTGGGGDTGGGGKADAAPDSKAG